MSEVSALTHLTQQTFCTSVCLHVHETLTNTGDIMGGLGRSMDGAHHSYSCAFTPGNGMPSCLEPFQCQSESPEAHGLLYVFNWRDLVVKHHPPPDSGLQSYQF